MKVEYLIAYDDKHWGTVVEEVPLRTKNREKLVDWAERNLATQDVYRKCVLFALYSIPGDE